MHSIIDIPWDQLKKSFKPWNANIDPSSEIIYSLLLDRFAKSTCNQITSYPTIEQPNVLNHRAGGDIKGVIAHLPYLKKLGVTTLLINPFLQNTSSSYHGYAIIDFLKVDEQLGTQEDLIELVSQAHALDMKVYFDAVLNHAGDVFSYFSMHRFYNDGKNYAIKEWNTDNPLAPIELRNFNLFERKGYIQHWEIEREAQQGDIFELKTFIQDLTTDAGSQVLENMLAIYMYWILLTNADGYRMDALKHLNTQFAVTWVERMSNELKALGKTSFQFLGEYIYTQAAPIEKQFQFPILNFEFYFFIHALNNQHEIVLESNRLHYLFIENHDQIGFYPKQRFNYGRTQSERFIWWRFLLILPNVVPILYYGSEQELTGRGDLDAAVREPLFEHDSCYLNDNTQGYHALNKMIAERSLFRGVEKIGDLVLNRINECIIGISNDECYHIYFNTSQHSTPLEALKFENNLSIDKKNVYLFQDERYKAIDVEDISFALPPLSILLITNESH